MFKKVIFFIILTSGISVFTSFKKVQGSSFTKPALRTIVIDAGHGGKDDGASGKYTNEKDITLAIDLKLQQTLQEAMPDVNIVMTRTTDVFDAPPVKAAKANAAGGDLFVSIHCDYAS